MRPIESDPGICASEFTPHTSFWRALFGNDNPVEIEIGSGTGTFLLTAAAAHPRRNFFGMERSRHYAAIVEREILRGSFDNARVIAADATCVLRHLIPAQSVATAHIYFPDPWWKRRHHGRRLFTPRFAADIARALVRDGRVCVATDVEQVFELIDSTLLAQTGFVRDADVQTPRTTMTRFEIKGLARGAQIREAVYRKV